MTLRPPPIPEPVLAQTRERLRRARLMLAACEVAAERGVRAVTLSAVGERAGMRSTVRRGEPFADGRECVQAAAAEAIERAVATVVPAWKGARGWPDAVSAGLAALLGFVDQEPQLARLILVDALGGDRAMLQAREQAVEQLTEAVDRARKLAPHASGVDRLTAQVLVGGVLAVLGDVTVDRDRGRAASLHGRLLRTILLPYLGPEQAGEQVRRLSGRAPTERAADPTKPGGAAGHDRAPSGHPVRLTVRAAMVLRAIAERPGASNRDVQRAAGIATSGDSSKLLNRLARQGLIENVSDRPGQAGYNAWQLTERGAWARAAASPNQSRR